MRQTVKLATDREQDKLDATAGRGYALGEGNFRPPMNGDIGQNNKSGCVDHATIRQ